MIDMAAADATSLTARERRLILASQRDFPLVDRPFAALGARVGAEETEVLADFEALAGRGVLARIGATYRTGSAGASVLAAISVSEADLDVVAEVINGFPEVNHNYEREHRFNLWFVVTAPDAARLDAVVDEIRRITGLAVLTLPMERAYRIDLGFPP